MSSDFQLVVANSVKCTFLRITSKLIKTVKNSYHNSDYHGVLKENWMSSLLEMNMKYKSAAKCKKNICL